MVDDWEIFKKSVSPIKDKTKIIFNRKIKKKQALKKSESNLEDLAGLDIKSTDNSKTLEKNILKKILKGKIRISATLDLHGYSLNESKKLVLKFINNNFKSQKRLVLIISGKGKRLSVADGWEGVGILKKNIPIWLNSVTLTEKVLWFDHAPPSKGGKGAFLIYLKKAIK